MGKQTSTRILKIRQAYAVQNNCYKASQGAKILGEELLITVPEAGEKYMKIAETLNIVYLAVVAVNGAIFFPVQVAKKK